MNLELLHFFDAAHKLPNTSDLVTKACARLHGHTYAVKVCLQAERLNDAGMVVDFKFIKNIIDRFDHRYINQVLKNYEIDLPPTAENIARILGHWLEAEKLNVESVAVAEGFKGMDRAAWVTWKPDNAL